jgi:hypothetical protein
MTGLINSQPSEQLHGDSFSLFDTPRVCSMCRSRNVRCASRFCDRRRSSFSSEVRACWRPMVFLGVRLCHGLVSCRTKISRRNRLQTMMAIIWHEGRPRRYERAHSVSASRGRQRDVTSTVRSFDGVFRFVERSYCEMPMIIAAYRTFFAILASVGVIATFRICLALHVHANLLFHQRSFFLAQYS